MRLCACRLILACRNDSALVSALRAGEFGGPSLSTRAAGANDVAEDRSACSPNGIGAGRSSRTVSHTATTDRDSSRGRVGLTCAPNHRCRQSWRRPRQIRSDGDELNFATRIVPRVGDRRTHHDGLRHRVVRGGWSRSAARSDGMHRSAAGQSDPGSEDEEEKKKRKAGAIHADLL